VEKFTEKSIKVSEETYKRINAIVGMLREREKKPVSMNTALLSVLPMSKIAKPSDFAGAWKMSESEADNLMKDTRKLWKSWKRY